MLSRFLLIVSVLLARMEDVSANIRRRDPWPNHMAPVNIYRQDSWPTYSRFILDCTDLAKILWNYCIIYAVLRITMYLLGILIGFISKIIWRLLTRDESGRDDGSDDRATTAPLGNHENKLNIGKHEAPRGLWAEKRDELKNIRIPPGRVSDLVAKFNSYQNASVNSDRHQEDKKHVPPPLLIFLKASERPTGFSEDEARPSQNRQ
ncbi:uncharacterized protein LOC143809171 isoform X2 [Ranitomeya variabilis]|uniref:uncharacterized protein LOC143809171 isoform X2 n=1 Tax=Ranitomeya variabilis TaxID=490064 RepID=UPI0040572C04